MSNKYGVLFYKSGYFFKPNLPFTIFGVMFARHLWHKDFITIAKIFCQRVFPSFLTLFFRIKFTSLEIFNVLLIGIVSFAAWINTICCFIFQSITETENSVRVTPWQD